MLRGTVPTRTQVSLSCGSGSTFRRRIIARSNAKDLSTQVDRLGNFLFPLGASKVHFGDDTPELVTATASAHHRPPDSEAERAAAFRSAGLGALAPNTVWNKPPRVNPITAGPRALDVNDFGIAAGNRHGRISANRSHIVMEHNVRNPVLGYHTAIESYKNMVPDMRTTCKIVEDANYEVPHLRSLGALRPHESDRW